MSLLFTTLFHTVWFIAIRETSWTNKIELMVPFERLFTPPIIYFYSAITKQTSKYWGWDSVCASVCFSTLQTLTQLPLSWSNSLESSLDFVLVFFRTRSTWNLTPNRCFNIFEYKINSNLFSAYNSLRFWILIPTSEKHRNIHVHTESAVMCLHWADFCEVYWILQCSFIMILFVWSRCIMVHDVGQISSLK